MQFNAAWKWTSWNVMVKEQVGLRLHGTGVIHGGEVIVAGGE